MPHVQSPAAEHPSASPAAHAAQMAPEGPHSPASRLTTQLLELSQHPGQDVESQTHNPPLMQRCPALHCTAPGPLPQTQAPALLQVSESNALHAPHATPGAAQVPGDIVEQVAPLQQPAVQDVASHVHPPPVQCWPGWHAGPP